MKRIFLLVNLYLLCLFNFTLGTTLLIKIPTRTRPDKFFIALDKFYAKLSKKVDCHFLITCDQNDPTMNNKKIRKKLASYPNLSFNFSQAKSKVDAYNDGLEKYDFDIVVLAADDMEPAIYGYDAVIVQTMLDKFPDLDGVLNFNDGHIGGECNTIPILGKQFYKMFGYAYNPIYKSLFCDSEITLVSRMLGKEAIINQTIIIHNHPTFTKQCILDDLYKHNNSFWSIDKKIFEKRRSQNFNITNEQLHEFFPKDWSILICTLPKREKSFTALYNKLQQQIKKNGLADKIEILYFSDNGENTIGFKRNSLLQSSKGLYVNFLDDDDDIHEDYIHLIYQKIQKNPDCVSLKGIITTDGKTPRVFIHSIKYNSYFEKNNIYYRPPNHLNTMKRCIASQVLFPEKNFGEDGAWAMNIAATQLLKKEEYIDIPYYYYLFVTTKK